MPECGCDAIGKAPMAPAVPSKRENGGGQTPGADNADDNGEMPAAVKQALATFAKAQAKALESSTWVGDKFAEKAREMHYGEADETPIHGKATRTRPKRWSRRHNRRALARAGRAASTNSTDCLRAIVCKRTAGRP